MLQSTVSNSTLAVELAASAVRIDFVEESDSKPIGYFIPIEIDEEASRDSAGWPKIPLDAAAREGCGGLDRPCELLTSDGTLLGYFVPDTLEIREQSARAWKQVLAHPSTGTLEGAMPLNELWERVHQSLGTPAGR